MRPIWSNRRALSAFAVSCSIVLAASSARALEAPAEDDAADEDTDISEFDDEPFGPRSNLRTRAEEVSFDARQRSLELSGNVRVDAPPFHLRSQRIRLTRTRYGVELVGKGSLAFCPCLGTPLKVDFDEALVAPPGDLILKNPTLRVYSVPVLPLPYFWLRSDEKFGVLPPDLAYRGDDGVFAGGGIHVPWKAGGGQHVLQLRAGAYVLRGFATDVRLRTPTSTWRVRYDRLPTATGDDGLVLDARGATSSGDVSTAWDADVVRGRRGVVATTELDAAARAWDRASVETALRGGGFVAAVGVRSVLRRGGALEYVDAYGPVASLRNSGSIGDAITYDATAEGGTLRLTGPFEQALSPDALSFARASGGAKGTTALGPVEASLALRGAVEVATNARAAADDRVVSARGRVALPVSRRFDAVAQDPWVHEIDPFAEASIVHASDDAILGVAPISGISPFGGTASIASGGVTTSLGRWGARESLEATAAGGGLVPMESGAGDAIPLVRARLAASIAWLGASAETAHVFEGRAAAGGAAANGFATVARLRLGAADRFRVLMNVAARDGIDPFLARALAEGPIEPRVGFLDRTGTTGGAGVVMPWSRVVTTSLGADVDATARELIGARGGVELRDRCGCLTLRVSAAHRVGRPGVDAWLGLDFALAQR